MSIDKLLALVIVTTLCTSVICQTPAKLLCGSKETCRDCLQVKECAWCREESYGRDRCFHPSLSSQVQCNEEFVYNPNNTAFALEDRLLSRTSGSSGGLAGASGSHSSAFGESSGGIEDVVQISPQKVQLKLRINQAHRINVNYAQAKEYPVDLYYLMDLSKSMEDDKIKLTTLGNTLSAVMKNITSDFRLGFGSFVDKVLMPYVSTVPKKLEQPCSNCTAPYGFKNNMPLNIDTEKFSTEVEHAEVSGNLDAPEGGFDAIMQAVVCRQQIGWREKARRLLVFSTDAGFHYAGDGKLGGVITPNDGKCHLDSEGMYSHSTIQDYPSISQINLKVKQNAINVIFAVVQEQHHVYQKLSEHVEGSSSRVLSTDSSNIVQLVKEEYSKISSSVEMKDNSTNAVKITYYSSCLKGGPLLPTNKCEGLKVGDVVKFEAEIVVTSCPQNRNDWHQMFQIYPVGINESLIIDLEMLCSCPCEEVGEFYSESCNTHGTYKCGICECDDSYFGKKCECSNTEIQSKSEKDLGCRHDNTTQVDCSGRGNCVCGVCECNRHQNGQERFSGKYCECDNHSCDHYNDLICSGSEHGECSCGVCMCRPGWGGSACECRQSNDTCIAPNNTEICSGRGECECGTCKCSSTDETRYSGKYCEKCPTCLGRCPEFRDCVECQMYNVGRLEEEGLCAENCTLFVPIPVDEVKPDLEQNERYCTFYDKYDCRYSFVYSEENNKVTVRAQEERECPPKVFMLGVVLGVIAAIVLIGLAILLLWKLLTSIHDRREFARFEKERMMAKWDTGENPIYKQATSTFKNPTYAGK